MHEIEARERELQSAVAARDVAALDRLLGQEFTLTTGRPGNEVRGRAEYLEITASRYVIDEYRFDELEVIELGPGAALVRSRYVQRGSMDGADRSQPFLMTDVWAHRPIGWQLVTRHVSPLRFERPLTASAPRIAPRHGADEDDDDERRVGRAHQPVDGHVVAVGEPEGDEQEGDREGGDGLGDQGALLGRTVGRAHCARR